MLPLTMHNVAPNHSSNRNGLPQQIDRAKLVLWLSKTRKILQYLMGVTAITEVSQTVLTATRQVRFLDSYLVNHQSVRSSDWILTHVYPIQHSY